MTAYYNENDPKAAAWLRELIAGSHVSAGVVDERSIADVEPADLAGFRQCHFFAGIGGWPHALRLAGWPDDRPVWTGSCPCQPFSVAGAGKGTDDERHLWPEFRRLIAECAPSIVFGEQVASPAGRNWLAAVRSDMEEMGYAVGAADLCAASVGAPHIRQRLFFGAVGMADANGEGSLPGAFTGVHRGEEGAGARNEQPERSRDYGRLGDTGRQRHEPGRRADLLEREARAEQGQTQQRQRGRDAGRNDGAAGGMADADSDGREAWRETAASARHGDSAYADGRNDRPRPDHGGWSDADWLGCTDGRWRPVEPGSFPLADGISGRMGLLRGYGNAIVPQVAAEFVSAFDEAH